MLKTRDLRIEFFRPLLSPAILLEELPPTEAARPRSAEAATRSRGSCAARTTGSWSSWGRAPSTTPRPASTTRRRLKAARDARPRPLRRDARLLREAAHDGGLEGAHQRPAPRRQLRHQRGPPPRAAPAHRPRTSWGCPPGASSSTRSRPSSPRTWCPGGPSARARRRARCTASWPRGCRCRSASRTAPTAACRSPSTPCGPAAHPHSFLGVTEQGLSAIVATRGNPRLPRDPARRPERAQLRRVERPEGGARRCATPGSRRGS